MPQVQGHVVCVLRPFQDRRNPCWPDSFTGGVHSSLKYMVLPGPIVATSLLLTSTILDFGPCTAPAVKPQVFALGMCFFLTELDKTIPVAFQMIDKRYRPSLKKLPL